MGVLSPAAPGPSRSTGFETAAAAGCATDDVVERIPFESDGFLAGTELMVKAMFKGYHVAEYPVALYRRTYGVSKAKLVRTILAHLRFQMWILLFRLRLRPLQFQNAHDGGKTWTQRTRSASGADRK